MKNGENHAETSGGHSPMADAFRPALQPCSSSPALPGADSMLGDTICWRLHRWPAILRGGRTHRRIVLIAQRSQRRIQLRWGEYVRRTPRSCAQVYGVAGGIGPSPDEVIAETPILGVLGDALSGPGAERRMAQNAYCDERSGHLLSHNKVPSLDVVDQGRVRKDCNDYKHPATHDKVPSMEVVEQAMKRWKTILKVISIVLAVIYALWVSYGITHGHHQHRVRWLHGPGHDNASKDTTNIILTNLSEFRRERLANCRGMYYFLVEVPQSEEQDRSWRERPGNNNHTLNDRHDHRAGRFLVTACAHADHSGLPNHATKSCKPRHQCREVPCRLISKDMSPAEFAVKNVFSGSYCDWGKADGSRDLDNPVTGTCKIEYDYNKCNCNNGRATCDWFYKCNQAVTHRCPTGSMLTQNKGKFSPLPLGAHYSVFF